MHTIIWVLHFDGIIYANNVWGDPRFKHLSFSQGRRGDLICYPGHTAIYLGNIRLSRHIHREFEFPASIAVEILEASLGNFCSPLVWDRVFIAENFAGTFSMLKGGLYPIVFLLICIKRC